MKYPEISKLIKIGSVTVKNRMMMAPMDTGFGNNAWGGFTPEGVEYFVRRAKDGFGLLFSGGTSVDSIVDGVDTLTDHADEFIRTGLEMNRRLAEYDCKMFIQLSMNVGRNAGLKTPSPLPTLGNPNVTTQALTIDEIHTKVRQAAKAAKIVQQAGFAGVDIHAMHWGHLLDSFALSLMNRREDEYGGSLENRLRFAKEIVEAIKGECGKDFPVTMRIALKSYMKGFNKASFDGSDEAGRTLEEVIEICKLLEQYGYDAVSTDVGTLDAFYYAMPPSYVPLGFTVDMAAEVKKAVNIPVLCGGRMADPDINEKAIAEGKIDAVVIGRQAIADSDYANKILEGKPEEVRTCIGCNQGCIWGYSTKGKVGCAVNPEVGYEARELTKTDKPKNVAIIGGGVAGMEAARVLTLRGHKVTIFEKSDHLGGNLVPAGAHDFKCEVASLNEYFKHQMKLMDIDVRLNCEMTAEKINALGADAVILALGSSPVMPKIKGCERENVISGEEALLGKKIVGERIIVVGGGLVGCEIAYGYAKEGRKVTVVEALDELMKRGDVPRMNKDFLLDAFAYYGTQICTCAKLTEVCDEGAVLESSDGTQRIIPCDTVIMSVGYRSLKSMKDELTAKEVYEIGDGRQVGNVLTCIADAYKVACEI